jgi:hypothetical protein
MTELLLTRSEEHGFFIWNAYSKAYYAALEVASHTSKAKPKLPNMGALLFETVATLNETLADDGILTRGEQGLGGWSTPELLRVRAKRLLAHQGSPERAEALLLQSLDCARRRRALSWELRSSITLAELWQSQKRPDAALKLLSAVHDRFTEGFATADLIRSASLITELRSST